VTLEEVLAIIQGKVISKSVDLSQEVRTAGGADLMSDVLAFGQEGMLLLTGLTNPQVVRTAEMAGVVAVVFVRGKLPPPETITLAEEKEIPLLASRHSMFETCGRLYKAGLPANSLFEAVLKQWHEAFDNRRSTER
jgi:predicted transcriptional regulator